ncbi:MAG: redoxin domain-containing protein [Planctomycetes bacterium]|nr:redoxin domain-containing protein [Planctomycetota bacterium]
MNWLKLTAVATLLMIGLCESTTQAQENTFKKPRQLWANSKLFTESPKMEFEKWLGKKPETEHKFIILEFWRTWCSACKKQTPVFNKFQKKYADDLVIISVTGETEDDLAKYDGPKKEYYQVIDKAQSKEALDAADALAKAESDNGLEDSNCNPDTSVNCKGDYIVDQQGVTEAAYGVFGWPHVVLLEPEDRVVVWEGFPLQEGYELSEEKLEKYFAVYKKLLAEKKQ